MYRDIQCRYRFVSYNELRSRGQGSADGYALPLTSGKFMGIFAHKTPCKSDIIHQLQNALFDTGLALDAMQQQGLGKRVINRHARVEGGVGILKNHLHTAPHIFQCSSFQ